MKSFSNSINNISKILTISLKIKENFLKENSKIYSSKKGKVKVILKMSY